MHYASCKYQTKPKYNTIQSNSIFFKVIPGLGYHENLDLLEQAQ